MPEACIAVSSLLCASPPRAMLVPSSAVNGRETQQVARHQEGLIDEGVNQAVVAGPNFIELLHQVQQREQWQQYEHNQQRTACQCQARYTDPESSSGCLTTMLAGTAG